MLPSDENACHSENMKKKRSIWRFALVPVIGIAAFLWLIFRSGTKPSRMSYPCQQAALSATTLSLASPFAIYFIELFRKLLRFYSPAKMVLILIALTGILLAQSDHLPLGGADRQLYGFSNEYFSPDALFSKEYRALVFHKTDCPQDPVGDRFPGLEDLIMMMGVHGLKFYKSVIETETSDPDGIIAADDTVIIKINYQWSKRGGTNTDLLSGLIRQIVDHPDIFIGEIVVCENSQFNPIDNFDKLNNNAQDTTQSPHDVVMHFQSVGYRVSHFSWTDIRFNNVNEYSQGDINDGYIVYPFDSVIRGCTSYPKFQSEYGTYISLKHGIWNPSAEVYDRDHLKFINVPVLKSHNASYGVTACVKNYMGVVTRELDTSSHYAIRYGILGDLLGEIQLADLNLLDCIWINADPNSGPNTTYDEATRKDMLVASQDPVAADIWADKNILIPAFIENGHNPPWPEPSADPDDPASDFREYLDNSMTQILEAGYQVTNDLTRIDVPPGEASDPDGPGAPFTISKDGDGYFLTWSAPISGGPADDYNLYKVSIGTFHDGFEPACEANLGSSTSTFVSSLTDDSGFIIVGRNATGDGSFGQNSQGRDRSYASESNSCP